MKTAKHDVNTKEVQKSNNPKAPAIAGGICAALCAILLSFTVLDCEKYKTDDSVPASITFSPPEKQDPDGFWEIFTDSLLSIFERY